MMAKEAGRVAYNHYLKTGDVFGMHEGAVVRGRGEAPTSPMSFEQFLAASRAIPKPPPERNPYSDEYKELQLKRKSEAAQRRWATVGELTRRMTGERE